MGKNIQQKYRMDNGDFATINKMMKSTNWESETADINFDVARTLFTERYDTKIETCIHKCHKGLIHKVCG